VPERDKPFKKEGLGIDHNQEASYSTAEKANFWCDSCSL
jgi:hypothetical protein